MEEERFSSFDVEECESGDGLLVSGNVGECDWLEGRLSEIPLMGQSTYVVLSPCE